MNRDLVEDYERVTGALRSRGYVLHEGEWVYVGRQRAGATEADDKHRLDNVDRWMFYMRGKDAHRLACNRRGKELGMEPWGIDWLRGSR